MRVRLLRSVKVDKTWMEPGLVCDLEDEIAESLICQKAAELLEEPIMVADSEEDETGREATTEELAEMAEELTKIEGINTDLAYRLIEAGFATVQSVAEAFPEDLMKVKGIGKKSVSAIQESAEDIIDN